MSICLPTAAACVAVAVAVSYAPMAAADPGDGFLDELATLGIALPGVTAADTVAAGYRTCDQLRRGVSVLDAMSAVEFDYRLPSEQGTLFVSAATTNLCPDFAG